MSAKSAQALVLPGEEEGRDRSLETSEPEASSHRFTRDGPPELETQLRNACGRIRAEVLRRLPARSVEGILLGGGYGRGEGGVLATESGCLPYNDLEFYVFGRGARWRGRDRAQPALQELGHELSAEVGVEVEFKRMTLGQLRRSPTSMFYYDLVVGHRWVLGSDALLGGCEHHRNACDIPLSEAMRLLMNRCSGLLFAREKLADPGPAEADFVGRNLAKAELGLGDVLLTAHRRYHWSCLVRHRRLRRLLARPELGPFAPLEKLHETGVEFKLHPSRTPLDRDRLLERLRATTAFARELWLWLETRRLRRPFSSIQSYALDPLDKCPETGRLKAAWISLRTFGPGVWLQSSGWHYPRERLLNSLALLLFEPRLSERPEIQRTLQAILRTRAVTRYDLVQAYERLWRRFN